MTRIKGKLFGGDPEKEFRWALAAFCLVVISIMFTIGALLFVRSESFSKACQEVQDNNVLLVDYLEESKERSLKCIDKEEDEGKIPLSTKEEINASFEPLNASFEPLLTRLKPVQC